jgi:hypothetical protein
MRVRGKDSALGIVSTNVEVNNEQERFEEEEMRRLSYPEHFQARDEEHVVPLTVTGFRRMDVPTSEGVKDVKSTTFSSMIRDELVMSSVPSVMRPRRMNKRERRRARRQEAQRRALRAWQSACT